MCWDKKSLHWFHENSRPVFVDTTAGDYALNDYSPAIGAGTISHSGINAPDLDFIPGLILGRPNLYHHGISHSLGAAVIFSCILDSVSGSTAETLSSNISIFGSVIIDLEIDTRCF